MAILLYISFKIAVTCGITAHIVAQITSASKANVYSCSIYWASSSREELKAGYPDVTIV
jgi:hypothetical protein